MSRTIQQYTTPHADRGTKKLAIMQPYFLPYIGYWQMMQAVDEFIIYDDVQYSKGGWINRNRLLLNGAANMFSVPLRKGNLGDKINQRMLGEAWPDARVSLEAKIAQAYSKAPFFSQAMPVIEEILASKHQNLADFLCESLQHVKSYLGIGTPLLRSSELDAGQRLRASDRVLAICQARGAGVYINAPGGRDLYEKDTFKAHGIDLHFIQADSISYPQDGRSFVPSLSILDVMMHNRPEEIQGMLSRYTLT